MVHATYLCQVGPGFLTAGGGGGREREGEREKKRETFKLCAAQYTMYSSIVTIMILLSHEYVDRWNTMEQNIMHYCERVEMVGTLVH